MEYLATLITPHGNSYVWSERRVMCFPHIINIATQAILQFIAKHYKQHGPPLNGPPPPTPLSDDEDDQDDHDVTCRDPIALCRHLINAIRASGKRREEFTDIVREGNRKGWFTVRDRQLLRDASTRWDSTLYMIRRFRELRKVGLTYSLLTYSPSTSLTLITAN